MPARATRTEDPCDLRPNLAFSRVLGVGGVRSTVHVSPRAKLHFDAVRRGSFERCDEALINTPAEAGLGCETVEKTALELEGVEFVDVVDAVDAGPAPSAARPTNYARSFFHVMSGVVSLTLIRVLPGRAALAAASGAFVLFAWTCEFARRRSPAVNDRLMRFFGPVAHPQERYRVNSSTWYVTALLLLALLAPTSAAELGVVVLAIADPVAGLIGRRFGRTRLRAGRSLEGTLAFFTAGTLAALAVLARVPRPARPDDDGARAHERGGRRAGGARVDPPRRQLHHPRRRRRSRLRRAGPRVAQPRGRQVLSGISRRTGARLRR